VSIPKRGLATLIGVISGTSMDAIDVAQIESDGEDRIEPGPGFSFDYPSAVAEELRAVVADSEHAAGPLAELERAVTDAHVAAVEAFLAETRTPREKIALVGFHGQTVLHRPEAGLTRQLLDGDRAAGRLQLDVVNDFRSSDVAAGGQGAPLAPLYHAAICGSLEKPLIVLNWGGVGNVTYLGPAGEIVAFDAGPANALIDDFVRKRTGRPRDENGELAARGRVASLSLERWMADPYFSRVPPKSLDRNHFRALTRDVETLSTEDGAATLAAFTIEATAAALKVTPSAPQSWLVAGGGRRNATLMRGLKERLAAHVAPIEEIGFDGDCLEAQIFAYLALRSRLGLPLSLPTTTGAPRPLTGGRFWPAPADVQLDRGS